LVLPGNHEFELTIFGPAVVGLDLVIPDEYTRLAGGFVTNGLRRATQGFGHCRSSFLSFEFGRDLVQDVVHALFELRPVGLYRTIEERMRGLSDPWIMPERGVPKASIPAFDVRRKTLHAGRHLLPRDLQDHDRVLPDPDLKNGRLRDRPAEGRTTTPGVLSLARGRECGLLHALQDRPPLTPELLPQLAENDLPAFSVLQLTHEREILGRPDLQGLAHVTSSLRGRQPIPETGERP